MNTRNLWALGLVMFVAACSQNLNVGGGGGTAPSAPTDLAAVAGNAKVTLTWTAVSAATTYNVYYKANSATASTSDSKATGSPFTAATAVVTGLTNGTQYGFAVTALNATGESGSSSSVAATPMGLRLRLERLWQYPAARKSRFPGPR